MSLQRQCIAVLYLFCLYLEFNKILALEEFYFGGLGGGEEGDCMFSLDVADFFGGANKEIQILLSYPVSNQPAHLTVFCIL